MTKLLKKILALTLVNCTLLSCSVEKVETEKVNHEAVASDYPIDKTMNYIINGNINYDYNKILEELSNNPVHVLYDYPKNRVVISVTKEDFENFKNSEPEFKKSYEKEPEQGHEKEKDSYYSSSYDVSGSSNNSNKTTAINAGDYYITDDSKDIVFQYYTIGFANFVPSTTSGSYDYVQADLNYNDVNTNDNTYSYSSLSHSSSFYNNGGVAKDKVYILFGSLLNVVDTATSDVGLVNNNANNKSITFYKYANFVGAARTIVLPPKRFYSNIGYILCRFSELQPDGATVSVGARSLKINY